MEPRLLSYFHFNLGIFFEKPVPIAILCFFKMILIIILNLIFILIKKIYCNSISTLHIDIADGTSRNHGQRIYSDGRGHGWFRVRHGAWRATRQRMRIHEV